MYYRPLVRHGETRPEGALPLAGGSLWFSEVELLSREAPPRIVPVGLVPEDVRHRLVFRRAAIAGLDMTRPKIMGILNVTPDSFSDGGRNVGLEAGVAAAQRMINDGAGTGGFAPNIKNIRAIIYHALRCRHAGLKPDITSAIGKTIRGYVQDPHDFWAGHIKASNGCAPKHQPVA